MRDLLELHQTHARRSWHSGASSLQPYRGPEDQDSKTISPCICSYLKPDTLVD